ncbi:MAG: hypothetical protein ACK6A9_16420 [Dolichospermum sp.]|nr:hypothetical protein [Dolichospermum circinale]MCE2721147.1 hypothetical protein [Anabaena sp. 49628_E55]MDB9467966.1 hypothetical protein [Dolichospermum circinale CS-539/09]MDB9480085.1 hypothetical protein [Dolichospermum circinale CS-537/03]
MSGSDQKRHQNQNLQKTKQKQKVIDEIKVYQPMQVGFVCVDAVDNYPN